MGYVGKIYESKCNSWKSWQFHLGKVGGRQGAEGVHALFSSLCVLAHRPWVVGASAVVVVLAWVRKMRRHHCGSSGVCLCLHGASKHVVLPVCGGSGCLRK